MPDLDDPRLEQIMRAGLAARAAHVDAWTTVPFTPSEHTNRSRRPWLLAAAAVAVVAIAVPVARQHPTPGAGAAPGATSGAASGTVRGAMPGRWRVESYAGAQLAVPPTWGWGGSPTRPLPDEPLADCGATRAFVAPGNDTYELGASQGRLPFVGRPVMMTDACAAGPLDQMYPQTNAVWFDSPLDMGVHTGAGGQVAQTVAVADARVTVFSRDPALRARILATVHAVVTDDDGCPTDPRQVDHPSVAALRAEPVSVSACVYASGGNTSTGSPRLLWSGRKTAAAAAAYDAALATSTPRTGNPACLPSAGQWISLGVNGSATDPAATRWDIVDLSCAVLRRAGATGVTTTPLSPDLVSPWAGDGIKAYVVGPSSPAWVARYFRGLLG